MNKLLTNLLKFICIYYNKVVEIITIQFQVLTMTSMKMAFFWDVALCSLVDDGGSKLL
jgi:hypothetical protein